MEYIVISPTGRQFRVKKKNLDLIPLNWKIITNRSAKRYYNSKTGKITNTYAAIREIKTEKDVQAVGATHETEFDLLFGRLSEIL
jgi:hypothetical protein